MTAQGRGAAACTIVAAPLRRRAGLPKIPPGASLRVLVCDEVILFACNKGMRGVHRVVGVQPSVRLGSSTGEQISNEIRAAISMRYAIRRPNRFVEHSREAGGGLTWAEQFLLKRKRLLYSK